MTDPKPLDPEPYIAANGHFRREAPAGENFVFDPRPEYEQDEAVYTQARMDSEKG